MEFWGTICKLKDEIDVLNHIQRKKQIWLKYDILEHRGTKWSYKAYAKELIVVSEVRGTTPEKLIVATQCNVVRLYKS